MFLPSTMTLSPGDSGEFVRELQRRLSTLSLYPAEALSGFYDGMTTSAVTSFQFQQGLRSDGIAGPETLRRLNGVLSGTAESTPAAATQPTEDVMKTFYAVDHLTDQNVAPAQQPHDVFSFQPAVAEPQPAQPQPVAATVQTAPQTFVPPAPTYQAPPAPTASTIDPFAAAMQQQQQFVPPAPTQQQTPPPQPVKPIDAMLQPAPQPATEKPIAQPVQEKPFQPPQPTQPQPVKPIDAMLQPAPQPITEKPPLQQTLPQQPQPVFTDKPAEPQLQPQKPLEQQPLRPVEPPLQPQQQQATKPAMAPEQAENEAAPERQTLRQRFTGMMQRIADYMESKLPQSVQAEVQKIGMQMAERGVREIPLPPNETALPSPSATPGRGPVQGTER